MYWYYIRAFVPRLMPHLYTVNTNYFYWFLSAEINYFTSGHNTRAWAPLIMWNVKHIAMCMLPQCMCMHVMCPQCTSTSCLFVCLVSSSQCLGTEHRIKHSVAFVCECKKCACVFVCAWVWPQQMFIYILTGSVYQWKIKVHTSW